MSFQRRRFTREELEQAWRANELRAVKGRLLSNYTEVDGGYTTPCWKWLGTIAADGYGQLSVNDCTCRAHRYSWLCHFGDIPENKPNVCHHCDNRWCIRPSHLFLDTAQGNTADMIAKGKDSFGWMNRGQLNGQARLTDEQVLDIRRKCATGMTHAQIALAFVGYAMVVIGLTMLTIELMRSD